MNTQEDNNEIIKPEEGGIVRAYRGPLSMIRLIGKPAVISRREMAKNPRNEELPTMEDLQNPDFYKKTFFADSVKKTYSNVNRQGINYLSQLNVNQVIPSDVRITPVKDNVFVFIMDFARYEQALQFGRESQWLSFYDDLTPLFYSNNSIGLQMNRINTGLESLVDVSCFSVDVDFRNHFSTPNDAYSFKGDIEKNDTARTLYKNYFEKQILDRAKEIEDKQKIKIKGVLLGDIKAEMGIVDGLFVMGSNPEGELLMGVSYLA